MKGYREKDSYKRILGIPCTQGEVIQLSYGGRSWSLLYSAFAQVVLAIEKSYVL